MKKVLNKTTIPIIAMYPIDMKGSKILISLPCSRVLHQDLQEEENGMMNPILDL